MERVSAAADPQWQKDVRVAIQVVARRGVEFTTDEVWGLLDAWGIPRPREPRAMGPAMTAAVDDRVIKRTGGYKHSTRPEAHANPKPQYEAVRVVAETRSY